MNNFGFIILLPFILSIIFLLWQQDVILPIIGGLFIGSIIVSRFNPFFGFLNISGTFIIKALTNSKNIFTLIIIAESLILFSLLNKSGFLSTLRNVLSKKRLTRNKLEYIVLLANTALFIDRNLSALLVGIFSKPLVEQKKLSAVKHAYLLNTVASSLWTIIPITTFIPIGIGVIGGAFNSLGIGYSPLKAFYNSLQFQYYNIFSFFIALTTIVLKKDIFLMKRYQLRNNKLNNNITFGLNVINIKQPNIPLALYGVLGSLFIVFGAIVLSLLLGKQGYYNRTVLNLQNYQIMFIIALFTGIIFSLLFSLGTKSIPYEQYKKLGNKKSTLSLALFLTIFYIILSMSIEGLAQKLGLFSLVDLLRHKTIPYNLIPLLIFIFSSIISFLSGSSLFTISTVMPIALKITSLNMTHPLIVDDIMFASIASVFSGSTFGDINSPFSLNFIIATASSESPLLKHFGSQIVYSFIAFFVTIIFGYFLFILNLKPYLSISSGLLVIFITFMLLNKNNVKN